MNKKAKNFLLIICVLFLQFSCTKLEYEEPFELFLEKENIYGKAVELNDLQINNPIDLLMLDSLLIIHDQYGINDTTFFLSIIDINSGKVLKYFGREGRGPDEFVYPLMLSKIPNQPQKIGVNTRRLFSYSTLSLQRILSDNGGFTLSEIKELSTGYSKVVKISENKLVGTGFFQEGRFGLSNEDGEILSIEKKYPFQQKFNYMDIRTLGMAFQSDLAVHPKKNLMVVTTSASANLDILALSNDSLKVINSIHSNPPLVEKEENSSPNRLSVHYLEENKRGYEFLSSTENFFYALYSGTPREEGLDKYLTGQIVLQFDWQGNPIKQFNLEYPAKLISVDNEDQYLFAMSADSIGRYSLIKYELK